MVTRSQPTVAPRRGPQAINKAVPVTLHVDAATPKKAASETPLAATGLKATKPKKAKMVRDSFTMPKVEYTVLDELKQRALALSHPAKKGELIRAGIKALAKMSDAKFLTAMSAVPAIKTGRPAKALIA
jgi:hypothetical protein